MHCHVQTNELGMLISMGKPVDRTRTDKCCRLHAFSNACGNLRCFKNHNKIICVIISASLRIEFYKPLSERPFTVFAFQWLFASVGQHVPLEIMV